MVYFKFVKITLLLFFSFPLSFLSSFLLLFFSRFFFLFGYLGGTFKVFIIIFNKSIRYLICDVYAIDSNIFYAKAHYILYLVP